MFEKNLKMACLLDFYGEILSERKQSVLSMYYNDDMSLAEIADEVGISRQGVRDLIKKAEEELNFFEEKLELSRKFLEAQDHLSRIVKLSDDRALSPELRQELQAVIDLLGQ